MPSASEKVNILLVDDRRENLLALEAILRGPDQNLVLARSGTEALKYLLRNEAAVILLDVEMPEMDGFQTAALIREREKTSRTPIIFLTAMSKSEVQVHQAYSSGGVDYLFKPLVPEILRSKVAAFVEMYKQSREMRRRTSELKAERDFVSAVLNTVNSLIVVLASDGSILRVNRAWEELSGFSFEETFGKRFWDFLDDAKSGEKHLGELGPGVQREDLWLTKNGLRLVSWCCTNLIGESGEKWIVITGIDITERKRIEEERAQLAREQSARAEAERLNEELERKVRLRTEELEGFTYSVSHDMRAPVRAVDGFTKILAEEYWSVLDDEGRRLLDIIRANTEKMGALIDGLLALSRLGREKLVFAEIDMATLAKAVFDEQRAGLDMDRKISLKLADLPPMYGDKRLIAQVLHNLISNALKFTKNSAATSIEVGFVSDRADDIYYVRDNGVGFDMNYAGKLFGTFQRLHSVNEFEGTGIGLATVQRIIHRHGGRVWAESAPGKGATFFFSVPHKDQLKAS